MGTLAKNANKDEILVYINQQRAVLDAPSRGITTYRFGEAINRIRCQLSAQDYAGWLYINGVTFAAATQAVRIYQEYTASYTETLDTQEAIDQAVRWKAGDTRSKYLLLESALLGVSPKLAAAERATVFPPLSLVTSTLLAIEALQERLNQAHEDFTDRKRFSERLVEPEKYYQALHHP